jgi:hypothetical protein
VAGHVPGPGQSGAQPEPGRPDARRIGAGSASPACHAQATAATATASASVDASAGAGHDCTRASCHRPCRNAPATAFGGCHDPCTDPIAGRHPETNGSSGLAEHVNRDLEHGDAVGDQRLGQRTWGR